MGDESTTAVIPASAGGHVYEGDGTCHSCDYSLRGLTETGTCPECGTPVWASIKPGPLGFLNARDARRLIHGIRFLRFSVWLGIINLIGLVFVLMSALLAVLLVVGVVITAFVAVLGWQCIALVRANGAGAGAVPLQQLLPVPVWIMTATLPVPAVVWTTSGFYSYGMAISFCLVVVASMVMLIIGQLRLVSLARRGRDGVLIKDANDATQFLVVGIVLGVAVILLTGLVHIGFVVFAPIGAFVLVAAGVAWRRFLRAMCEAAARHIHSTES